MFTFGILALVLSALSSALPALIQEDAACSTPSDFTVQQFGIFTPSTGNTHPSNLVFIVSDSVNSRVTCASTITSNPTTPIACANSNVEYLWDGSKLTVGQTRIPCGNSIFTAQVFGDIHISLDCIPSIVPFGQGTLCQDPVGELTGQFTRSTLLA